MLGDCFKKPTNFDLEEHLEGDFRLMTGEPRKVRIRVASEAAHVIRERNWHPSQQLQEMVDGGIEISLQAPINYEIISWILGFGPAAEVRQPVEFRNRIAKDFEAAALQYRSASRPEEALLSRVPASF